MADTELNFSIGIEADTAQAVSGINNVRQSWDRLLNSQTQSNEALQRGTEADEARVRSLNNYSTAASNASRAEQSRENVLDDLIDILQENTRALTENNRALTENADATDDAAEASSKFSGFTKALTAGGKLAVDAFEELISKSAELIENTLELGTSFEESFQKVKTLADASVISYDELSQSFLGLSRTYGAASADINEAAYQALSASVKTEDLAKMLDVAERASIAGFTDTTVAIDGLTSVINTYGLSIEEADGLANKFLITQNLGKTTFGEIASYISEVAPLAAAAGVSIDDLLSSVATLTALGTPTDQAMTQIKSALNNIVKPSSKASKAAQELGIDFSASALKAKGWSAFLEEINEATDGDAEVLSKLFGRVEAVNGVLALTGGGADIFNNALSEMSTNTSALDEAFEKMTDNVNYQKNVLITSLQSFSVEIFNSLNEPLKEGLSEANSIINELITAFEEGGIDGIYEKFSQSSEDFYNLAASMIEQLSSGFIDNSDKIFAIGGDLLVKLGTGILNSIPAFIEVVFNLVNGLLDALVDASDDIALGALYIIEALAKGIDENLGHIVSAVISIVTIIGSTILENINIVVEAILTIISAVVTTILNPDVLEQLLTAVGQLLEGLFKGIVKSIDSLIKMFIEAQFGEGGSKSAEAFKDAFVKRLNELDWTDVAYIISPLIGSFFKLGQLSAESFEDGFNSGSHSSGKYGGGAGHLRESLEDVQAAAKDTAENIQEEAEDTSDVIIEETSRVLTYFDKGIAKTAENYRDTITQLLKDEEAAFKKSIEAEKTARKAELDAQLEAVKSYYKTIEDEESKRHKEKLNSLKEEQDRQLGIIDEEEYQRELSKMKAEEAKISADLAKYGAAENLYTSADRKARASLEEKLAAQREKIDEKIHDHDVKLKKEAIKSEYDSAVDAENKLNEVKKSEIQSQKNAAVEAKKAEVDAAKKAIDEEAAYRTKAFTEAQKTLSENLKSFSDESLEALVNNWDTYINHVTGTWKGALEGMTAAQADYYLSLNDNMQSAFNNIRTQLKSTTDDISSYMDIVDSVDELSRLSPERRAAKASALDLTVQEAVSLGSPDFDISQLVKGLQPSYNYGTYTDNSVGNNSNNTTTTNNYYNGTQQSSTTYANLVR